MEYVVAKDGALKQCLLEGPAGCGKTSLAFHVHSTIMKRPPEKFLRVVVERDTTMQDILLDRTLEDGNVKWVVKKALTLLQDPEGTVVIDEAFAGAPDMLLGLNSLADDDRYITLPDGKTYTRHKDAVLILTTNPQGYAGVKRQHAGFTDRFPRLLMGYHPDEHEIVSERAPSLEPERGARLVELWRMLRVAKEKNNMHEVEFSTRSLITCATLLASGMEDGEALKAVLRVREQDEWKAVDEIVRTVMNTKFVRDTSSKKGGWTLEEIAEAKKLKGELKDAQKKYDDSIKEKDAKIADLYSRIRAGRAGVDDLMKEWVEHEKVCTVK
jgi:MoxR-like ATPase